ncbi:hypothetical protein J2S53_002338 [Actinopolyspora lacussalsi]|nr:hypothetical protein [Actinopolyspora lacussalsi]
MSNHQIPVPAVTEGMRQQALANPGKRVYVVDPEFDANGSVPGWGVRGAFPVSESGDILTNDYIANPKYFPGPKVRGFPEPRNAVERALELAASGYGPEEGLVAELVGSGVELLFSVDPGDPGRIPVVADQSGTRLVYACTSEERNTSGGRVVSIPVAAIRDMLSEVYLVLNAGSVPSVSLPGRDIVAAMSAESGNG